MIKERNQANRDNLIAAQQAAGNLIGPKQRDAGTQLLLEKSLAAERQEIAAAEAKASDERAKKFDEWVKKQGDAFLETLRQNGKKIEDERKLEAELSRQLQLKQEIARSDAMIRLRMIEENPHLSDAQKQTQSIPQSSRFRKKIPRASPITRIRPIPLRMKMRA